MTIGIFNATDSFIVHRCKTNLRNKTKTQPELRQWHMHFVSERCLLASPLRVDTGASTYQRSAHGCRDRLLTFNEMLSARASARCERKYIGD
jgi:hypothetical protein